MSLAYKTRHPCNIGSGGCSLCGVAGVTCVHPTARLATVGVTAGCGPPRSSGSTYYSRAPEKCFLYIGPKKEAPSMRLFYLHLISRYMIMVETKVARAMTGALQCRRPVKNIRGAAAGRWWWRRGRKAFACWSSGANHTSHASSLTSSHPDDERGRRQASAAAASPSSSRDVVWIPNNWLNCYCC